MLQRTDAKGMNSCTDRQLNSGDLRRAEVLLFMESGSAWQLLNPRKRQTDDEDGEVARAEESGAFEVGVIERSWQLPAGDSRV